MTRARAKDDDRPRKKADKKRPETASEGGKRAHNGDAVLNGKPPSKEGHNRRNGGLQRDSKSTKSGRWSLFGLVNLWLMATFLVATVVFVGVYTGGDLSAEGGLRAAWPRLKRNSEFLLNRTLEALGPAAEGAMRAATQAWTYAGPWLQKVQATLALSVSSARNLLAGVLQAAGVTEDHITQMREGAAHVAWLLVEKVGSLWEAGLRAVDWEAMFAGVREVWAFMVDQFRVLNAELWRNEAVTALWEDVRGLLGVAPTPSS